MTSLVHIAETASLILAAYLAGCLLGYVTRRILYAGRGTRQPTVVAVASPVAVLMPEKQPVPKRVRTPAARLAAAASHEPTPMPPKPAPKPKAAPASKRRRVDPKPATLDAPRNGQPDDLKQIKGIGPKIEASLNAMGIYHLDQIAAWTKDNIDWVDGQLAFKGRIRRERWVEQAAELAGAPATL
jgi:predicted flap endonuclease-1-like 5' DNA nuclease